MSDAGTANTTDVVRGYAEAIFVVARAEGVLDRCSDEVFRFARAVEAAPELRDKLTDPAVDAGAKLDVVNDLLSGRAHPQTTAAVVWIVQAGRIRQLEDIANALADRAAATRDKVVAEIRSAVDLDDTQRQRLAEALSQTTGKDVEPKVVVDPDVVGGIVVTVGDTVIDGSVSRRLAELRSRLTGG